ncbi:class A beta-lactamase [Streptomyces sp. LaPpAH-108]|uniref:class A beta-lactamase n=1 Tax=Streptomyces sp. LaPpAH-108 TaxID=1155714 RepID=UPI00037BE98F|nr:class A beta-lactamase [Streptomyces sp. LaPpAH-108]
MPRTTSVPRRRLLRAGGALAAAAAFTPTLTARAAADSGPDDVTARLRALEREYDARLGVYARNTRTGRTVAYRAGEPFAMCSLFKAFAAAAVLRDHSGHGGQCGAECGLDELIHFPPADILSNSEHSEDYLETGMPVRDACALAIRYSDNTAGNLMLRRIGGPAGLTRFFRSLGDEVSRLDRWETDLNTAIPGDPRDTSTPYALGRSLERLTLGSALSAADRRQLVAWLSGNTTSTKRFRAGLPADWTLADKTGTGSYASAHDLGIAWTTRRTPVVLTVLTTKAEQDAPVDESLIERTARVLASAVAPGE